MNIAQTMGGKQQRLCGQLTVRALQFKQSLAGGMVAHD